MTLMEKFNMKLSSIIQIPELRERIVFTLLMFLVARVGTYIPAPGVDVDRLATMTAQSDILGYINMFSGGAFKRVSIFALGIVPYINSSIVFSLLAVIIPKIEEIQKDIEKRDYLDSHREISPLKKAEDAIEIDSSNLTIDETIEEIINKMDKEDVL